VGLILVCGCDESPGVTAVGGLYLRPSSEHYAGRRCTTSRKQPNPPRNPPNRLARTRFPRPPRPRTAMLDGGKRLIHLFQYAVVTGNPPYSIPPYSCLCGRRGTVSGADGGVRSMSRYRPAAPYGWCARPLVCWRLNGSAPPMTLAFRLCPSASSRSAGPIHGSVRIEAKIS